MPNAAGAIQGINVPTVPWLQRFAAGDKVRTVRGLEDRLGDVPGTVVFVDRSGLSERSVMVELDHVALTNARNDAWESHGDTSFMFTPGELRRLA